MDIRTISSGLYAAKTWMKLVAVMMIIYGALVALSIVGIIVAWLPIWMGVLLFQSANLVEQAHNGEDPAALTECLNRLKTYFTIMGILTMIGLVVGAAGFMLGGMAALTGM